MDDTEHDPGDVRDALKRVRARLARGWTQGRMACMEDGATCASGLESIASCFCLEGAVQLEPMRIRDDVRVALVRQLDLSPSPIMSLADELTVYNDHQDRTQADILALVDAALTATNE